MIRLRSVPSFVLAASAMFSMALAQVEPCLDSEFVTVVVVGGTHSSQDSALADATLAAINAAIQEVRGVFVAAESETWTTFKDGVVEDGVSERISARFAGFVPSFSVDAMRRLGNDAIELTATVEVCLDDRVAIFIESSPPTVASAIAGALSSRVRPMGWQFVAPRPPTLEDSRRLLDFALEHGVTLVAVGTAEAQASIVRGIERGVVVMNLVIFDVRTLQVVDAVSATGIGFGPTADAARRSAIDELASDAGTALIRSFTAPGVIEPLTLVFEGLRRGGTANLLPTLIAEVDRFVRIVGTRYLESEGRLIVDVEAATDACSFAEGVTLRRRVTTYVETCSDGRATLRLVGD